MFTSENLSALLEELNYELIREWRFVFNTSDQFHELHRTHWAFWIHVDKTELSVRPDQAQRFQATIRITIEMDEPLSKETAFRLTAHTVIDDDFMGGVLLVNGTTRNGVPDYAQWMATLTITGKKDLIFYLKLKLDF